MPEALVNTTHKDRILTIRLDRPAKRNALSVELLTQLRDALTSTATRSYVQCVVITGSDRFFGLERT